MPWPAVIGSAFVLVLAGCSGDRLDLHEVTGTVKFTDGTVPQGEMSTITFIPAIPLEGKAASSHIDSDGSFRLWTVTQGDGGALAGDYLVTVTVINGYPQGKSVVASKYTHQNETPLQVTVEAGEKNHFNFQVEKP
jgi:hypothetical protein